MTGKSLTEKRLSRQTAVANSAATATYVAHHQQLECGVNELWLQCQVHESIIIITTIKT